MTIIAEVSILVGTHLLLAGGSWLFGNHIAKKKKIKQFYRGLKPVVKLVSNFRKDGYLNEVQTKQFIKTISTSFNDHFEIGTMLTKDYGEYDNQTNVECGICGDKDHKMARHNLCAECDLNCSIWNFK